MMELAVRNYIRSFKWQNIKEKNGAGLICIPNLFIACIPLINNDEPNRIIAACILILIPIFFAICTSALFPMALPKLMYLCPMSKEMRKDYIMKACFVRTLAPLILSIVAITIMLIVNLTDWICALGILLNHFLFAVFIGSGISVNEYRPVDERIQISTSNMSGYVTFIIIIVSLISCIAYANVYIYSDILWVKLLLMGITLFVSLPATLNYLKYWPSAVENALSYETSMAKPPVLKK